VSRDVIACRACPRLVEWRETVAAEKVARFANDTYWGKPLPGFGDPKARVVLVGLAPAAHGGNRTGRMFTGDRSGDFLYGALHRAGFASAPVSRSRSDGLRLTDAYLTAVNRCAPPGNRPTPAERDRCLPFLERELRALGEVRVIVALGAFAWDGTLRALGALGHRASPKPRFGHGAEIDLGPYWMLGCFHPSQQNTFTGKLTPAMLDAVLSRARRLAGHPRGVRARSGSGGPGSGRTPG
jgi:uracil-DNA glycosylase